MKLPRRRRFTRESVTQSRKSRLMLASNANINHVILEKLTCPTAELCPTPTPTMSTLHYSQHDSFNASQIYLPSIPLIFFLCLAYLWLPNDSRRSEVLQEALNGLNERLLSACCQELPQPSCDGRLRLPNARPEHHRNHGGTNSRRHGNISD